MAPGEPPLPRHVNRDDEEVGDMTVMVRVMEERQIMSRMTEGSRDHGIKEDVSCSSMMTLKLTPVRVRRLSCHEFVAECSGSAESLQEDHHRGKGERERETLQRDHE